LTRGERKPGDPRQDPNSFAPDGKHLAYTEGTFAGGGGIWTLPVESDAKGLRVAGKPEVFVDTPADERQAAFSPDGRWLAYSSNESGTYQVHVLAFPDKRIRRQISTDGGAYPVWSRTAQEIFFRTEDAHIMVAGYTVTGESFDAHKPRLWSAMRLAQVGTAGLTANFDLAPDGKRIVAVMEAGTPGTPPAPRQVTFLLNFFDELRRRVPAD
jgi:serine/threonine-protein kinase